MKLQTSCFMGRIARIETGGRAGGWVKTIAEPLGQCIVEVRKSGVKYFQSKAALPGTCKPIWAGRPWAVLWWLWTRYPALLQVFFASTSGDHLTQRPPVTAPNSQVQTLQTARHVVNLAFEWTAAPAQDPG